MKKQRFSYLCLDEGEHYVRDFVCTCICSSSSSARSGSVRRPSAGSGLGTLRQAASSSSSGAGRTCNSKGRLRLCTLSLIFEPDALQEPIVKLPLKSVTSLDLVDKAAHKVCVLSTNKSIRLKTGGRDEPYIISRGAEKWELSLPYADIKSLFNPLNELWEIEAKVKSFEEQERRLDAITAPATKRKFDPSCLVEFSEQILTETPVYKLTPLIREPGCLVLTNARLYFQPAHNPCGDSPVRSKRIFEVGAVAKRRSALRDVGVEIFFVSQYERDLGGSPRKAGLRDDSTVGTVSSGPRFGDSVGEESASWLFAFDGKDERDRFHIEFQKLINKKAEKTEGVGEGAFGPLAVTDLLDADSSMIALVQSAWMNGDISNFDYLLFLNLTSGRSFNDITQYPVFPWVLKDYTSREIDLENPETFRDLSKPIGALNTKRLEMFWDRYNQMPLEGDRFLYGTHYSTPGYVLFWLVRAAGAYMLRLQNGKFDAPDRLFSSISECWESVLSNFADLKELIPEFFSFPSDFLVNKDCLPLGRRQNNIPVHDVELPSWASSPDEFIVKHRLALESAYISKHLHQWIDLIWGYKQRGEKALKFNNLFHPLTYEGVVDLDKIDDPVHRRSMEAQINEFGQTPKQLFKNAHPERVAHCSARGASPTDYSIMAWLQSVRNAVARVSSGPVAARITPLEEGKSKEVSLPSSVRTSLSISVPSWGTMPKKLLEVKTLSVHKGPVSYARLSKNGQFLYSIGEDSMLKVSRIHDGSTVRSACLGSLPLTALDTIEFENIGKLNNGEFFHPLLVVGSLDNRVYSYNVDYGRVMWSFIAHDDSITAVKVVENPDDKVSILLTAGGDGTVRKWNFTQNATNIKPSDTGAGNILAEHDFGITAIEVVGGVPTNSLSYGSPDRPLVCISLDEDKRIIGTDLHTNSYLWQIESQDIVSICHHSLVLTDSQDSSMAHLFDGKVLSFSSAGCLYALDYLEGSSVEVGRLYLEENEIKTTVSDMSHVIIACDNGRLYIYRTAHLTNKASEVIDEELVLTAELGQELTSIDAVVLAQEDHSAKAKGTALFACGFRNGVVQVLGN